MRLTEKILVVLVAGFFAVHFFDVPSRGFLFTAATISIVICLFDRYRLSESLQTGEERMRMIAGVILGFSLVMLQIAFRIESGQILKVITAFHLILCLTPGVFALAGTRQEKVSEADMTGIFLHSTMALLVMCLYYLLHGLQKAPHGHA